jgi:hypothetical protein
MMSRLVGLPIDIAYLPNIILDDALKIFYGDVKMRAAQYPWLKQMKPDKPGSIRCQDAA